MFNVIYMLADSPGWWMEGEILVLPIDDELLSATLQVVQITYKGNSTCSDKDNLWKNWSMMVQVVTPASAEGICHI